MNVGIFGLGIIGRIWAENLHRDGVAVRGWNRTPKAGLPFAVAGAREAAAKSDLLVVVVSDPAAVEGVLRQILPELRAGKVVVQSSTISPEATCRFAAQVEKAGASFLEAPFMGSKPAAEQRQLVFLTGGDPAVLERARPVLSRLARAIEHVGPTGSASALKLAFNLNIALVARAHCEGLALARSAGIRDERFFELLRANVGHSGLATLKEPKLRARDWSPQFSLKHQAKDVRLALEAGRDLPLAQGHALLRLIEEGIARGWGDDDFIGLIRQLDQ
jgi:3-hydroxyisobutyrate dehydrogenase-like beta-hydroxyacid dehydrogenase